MPSSNKKKNVKFLILASMRTTEWKMEQREKMDKYLHLAREVKKKSVGT